MQGDVRGFLQEGEEGTMVRMRRQVVQQDDGDGGGEGGRRVSKGGALVRGVDVGRYHGVANVVWMRAWCRSAMGVTMCGLISTIAVELG